MNPDIDKLTDIELEKLLEDTPIECKIGTKTGELKCDAPEWVEKAMIRLNVTPKKLVFDVESEVKPAVIAKKPVSV